MTAAAIVVALVIAQRLAELCIAGANTRTLRQRGGIETDAAGYPWLVVLHAAWIGTLVVLTPNATLSWPWLGVFLLLQGARAWTIASLGRRWTTRVIVLPGAPLVAAGPYRYLRHPNYAIVATEIFVLPLALGAPATALISGAANLVLLRRRIAIENRALGLT